MLRLMLLRHAKSLSTEPHTADHERPLADRGLKAAPLMGRYAKTHDLTPELILTSPARRARQTAELFVSGLGGKTPMETVKELYDFGDGRALLDVVRRRGRAADPLMLVGHNPAMQNLARRLVRSGDKEMIAELQRKFPTAALGVIDFEIERWAELGPSTGELVVFATPRALQETG